MNSELLSIAVKQTSLSGLTELLRVIADETNSYACILWRTAPKHDGSRKYLFAVAEWCRDEIRCVRSNLSMEDSFTGNAIQSRSQRISDDVGADVRDRDSFLIEGNITSMCTTPVHFLDSQWGAVNIYRQGENPYSETTASVAQANAMLLPALLQLMEDEVSFWLYRQVDQFIHEWQLKPAEGNAPITATRRIAKRVANALKIAFNCEEVSIFLEDRLASPGVYQLAFTTWKKTPFRKGYHANEENGITGFSLMHPEKKVIIFDLEDDSAIRARYPGMKPLDSLRVRTAVRADPAMRRPKPLSLMTAPMRIGGRVVGIIRCAIGRGPVYFDQRQHLVLERVASQFGSFWRSLLDRLELDEENRSLGELVRSITHLNNFAHVEIMKDPVVLRAVTLAPRSTAIDSRVLDSRILKEALQITHNVIRGAEITDVRMREGNKLKFQAIHGKAWENGTRDEIDARKNREYDVEERPPRSAGVRVMQTGEIYEVKDPNNDEFYFESFPDTKHMLLAPLKLASPGGGDENYGVLDIRSVVERDFTKSARHIALLLGTQLALYHQLSMVVKSLRDSIEELERVQARQIQTNEDLAHQLKHPTMTAHARLDGLVRVTPEGDLKNKLRAARGVCARAMHVAASTRLFATLAAGRAIKAEPKVLTGEDLLKLLVNSAQDAAYVARGEQKQKGSFHVVPDGFLAISDLEFDVALLEQAVTQLLDNAFKYSFPDSQVLVNGGYTARARDRIRISVFSEGITLHSSEVRMCMDRGWQSEDAKEVSDTSSGIGLWMVSNIMEAHTGILSPKSTDSEGKTEFALIFPARQK